jgi:hypothetical protein
MAVFRGPMALPFRIQRGERWVVHGPSREGMVWTAWREGEGYPPSRAESAKPLPTLSPETSPLPPETGQHLHLSFTAALANEPTACGGARGTDEPMRAENPVALQLSSAMMACHLRTETAFRWSHRLASIIGSEYGLSSASRNRLPLLLRNCAYLRRWIGLVVLPRFIRRPSL